MTDLLSTACFDCGRSWPPGRKRCDCGQPVWFATDPGAGDFPAVGDAAVRHSAPGIWRFADALPVDAPDAPGSDLGAGPGATPLLRASRVEAGLDGDEPRVWVKDETANPTGTFKDRGTTVAVHGVGARHAESRIGTVSHGNMAISTAAFAAATGRGAVVLVPADVSDRRLAAIARFDPEILRVDGDYGRLYHETLALDTPGVDFVNSDTPLRVAGQKTVAYEVCEGLGRAPDAVVLPVSSGGHASAVWKGLRELAAAGAIDDLPRIYLVQAAACAPVAEAFESNRSVRPVTPGETAAYSIANPDPPSGDRALAAVRATGGAALAVDEPAIRRALDEFARQTGLCVESGSAVALAGLRTLVEDREAIGPDEDAVVIATGTGFRDLDAGGAEAPVVDLEDLADRL